MSRRTRLLLAVGLAPLVIVLLLVAAWAIDAGAAGGQVSRNVSLAGLEIGGLSSDSLLERVEALDVELATRPVRIVTPEVTYETRADEIGLRVDEVATAEAALDAGRTGMLPRRPFRWAVSFFSPIEVDVQYQVDPEVARATLRRLEGDALVSPVEPSINSEEGNAFTVIPGLPGTGIDPSTLQVALAAAATSTPIDEAVVVQIQQAELAPRLTLAAAGDAAATANALTAGTLTVNAVAGETTATARLVPRELRRLVTVREVAESIEVFLDPEVVLDVLTTEFAELVVEPADASITLVDGRPVITPSITGFRCCSMETAEDVAATFGAGLDEITIELDVDEATFTTQDAEELGIIEEVGSPTAFGPTTQHRCCENRVKNIQRMADIVRGAIIRPGETFSINDYVGRRTIEKGFFEDGVIYDGVLTTDVGGGVSQFATTFFNAALYAGLEFGQYQSHSLYISRYPRGHEATISFPAPDLQIKNQTEYGVMIWPEYTETSITVRLYSTDHIDVALGDPTARPQGNCTRWTTPRTRTYEDGTTATDSVFALYRPREGVDC